MPSETYFFLHIPKTAGTTFNKILDANFSLSSILEVYRTEEYDKFDGLDPEEAARYALIRGHVLITDFGGLQRQLPGLRLITFLREPTARVLSEYYFLKTWPYSHVYKDLNERGMSLAEYVASEDSLYRHRGKNLMTTFMSGVSAVEEPRRALDQAKRNIETLFAFTGIAERFDESLLLLKKIMPLQNICYERQNVRSSTGSEEIDPATLDVVRRNNRLDAELYEFAKQRLLAEAVGKKFDRELSVFRTVNSKFQRIARLITERDCPQTLKAGILNPK